MRIGSETSRALATVWQNKLLWLANLLGALALVAAFWGWLLIPEASLWQLAAAALAALLMMAAALWLLAGDFAYFAEAHGGRRSQAWPAFRRAIRRVPALLLWAVLLAIVLLLLGLAQAAVRTWAEVAASWLTLNMQQPISPDRVEWWLLAALAGLWWLALALLLPLAREMACDGFAALHGDGRRNWWRTVRRLGYWLAALLLYALGWWLPVMLVGWVIEVRGLALEFTSAVIRFSLAAALALTAWLWFLSLIALVRPLTAASDVAAADPQRLMPRSEDVSI